MKVDKMLTICFCFRVRRILLESKNLGNTGRGPNTLSQVRAGRVVRMHPVLGTQTVTTFRAFHLLREQQKEHIIQACKERKPALDGESFPHPISIFLAYCHALLLLNLSLELSV